MKRAGRLLAHAFGVGLIVLVLWLVGWNDRVTDTAGVEHVGRVVSRGAGHVVLETGAETRRIAIDDARAVRGGLRAAFAALSRHPLLALAGVALHLSAVLCTFVRWGVLLAGAELATPRRDVFRLSWVGMFFSAAVPGGIATGDVVKSVYIARTHAGRKTRSVVTVFVDRIVGLAALCLIATGAVLVAPKGSRVEEAAKTVVLVLLGLSAVAGVLLFSARLRAALRLPLLLERLPFRRVVTEIREAMAIYGARPRAVIVAGALALAGHLLFLAAFFFYASAMETELSLMALCVAIPVAQMLAAVPGLPGGWGVGDFAFFFFLPAVGVPAAQAVALSFTYRLAHTLLALPGGLMLARYGK